jgi:hypothetical protein
LFKLQKFTHILFLSALLLPSILFGQKLGESDLVKGEFQGGLKLGICTSQIHGDGFGGFNKVGAIGGPFVTTRISDKLKLQLEMVYCNRGSRDPARPDKGKYDTYKISAHYIDIPILLKMWIWKFELEAGLNNGVFISHSESDENGLIPEDLQNVNFSRYELAANLGVNIEINEKWFSNVRFHYSILPINTEGVQFIPTYGFAGGAFNNTLMFSINRRFIQKNQ